MMYLMRSRMWSAQKSRDYCIAARSLVCPNDGFWRVLCALEGPLGILERSVSAVQDSMAATSITGGFAWVCCISVFEYCMSLWTVSVDSVQHGMHVYHYKQLQELAVGCVVCCWVSIPVC